MIRHILAPILPAAAASLGLPRTLAELHASDPALAAGEGTPASVNRVALTFDDGPHPEGTPAILEMLAGRGAVATFFLVGEQVERRPELVREIDAAGHHVALHGYQHRLQLLRAPGEMHADIARGVSLLEEVIGRRPMLHRAPFGIYSRAGIEAVLSHGLRPLLWSRWGRDWRRFITPRGIARRVTGAVTSGDVVLLHDADSYSARDSHRRTAQALGPILTELHARGLDTVLPV